MVFPDGFSSYLKRKAFKFRSSNLEKIPSNTSGIYVFIYKRRYLYVGQSGTTQGMKERLYAHMKGSHNSGLRKEYESLGGTLRVTWIPCAECDLDDLEKSLINHLEPVHNEIRYSDYIPRKKKWEIGNG